MPQHAQLLLRDARGPMSNLLQRLSGEKGHDCLTELNRFLRGEYPWCDERLSLGDIAQMLESLRSQAGVESVAEVVRGINSDEWVLKLRERCFREKNGIFYFSVTSDGTLGPDWIPRLEAQNFNLTKWSRDVLSSPDFVATCGVTYNLAVMPGELFADQNRSNGKIREEAARRGWKHGVDMPTEIGCLMRQKLTDEDIAAMGLTWLVAMHEPVEDSYRDPRLLCVSRYGYGRDLSAHAGTPGNWWNCDNGFMALVSQVSSENLDV